MELEQQARILQPNQMPERADRLPEAQILLIGMKTCIASRGL